MKSYLMQNQKVDFVEEWCVLLDRKCWEKIGPWPEKLPQIGMAFIMTTKAQQLGFKPQVIKNSVLYHYRVFSLDINEFERLTEQAMNTIPQLLKELQQISKSV